MSKLPNLVGRSIVQDDKPAPLTTLTYREWVCGCGKKFDVFAAYHRHRSRCTKQHQAHESRSNETTDATGDDGGCATRNAHAAVAGVSSATAHKQTTPDPLTEDLWITPLMGPAHLFPAGQSTALCGRPWIGQAWNGERERPALNLCCSRCAGVDDE
jgi:hypothetical protein